MREEGFDPTDFSVVVKLRGNLPKAWKWEIYRAGRWGPVESSPVFFESMAVAAKEGKKALAQLLVFAPMANLRVTCDCGAIYEVIETKGPSRESRPAKCVLCDREMFAWEGDNVGQLHLIWRPDEDRE